MKSKKRQGSPEGEALHHSRQEKAVNQSRLSTSPKARQQSDEEPKLSCTEGQQDSDTAKASLLSIVLKKALHHLNQLGEQDSVRRTLRVNELLENGAGDGSANHVSRVRISLTPQPQEISRTDPFAASTSGPVKRESERLARLSKKKGSELDSSEESADRAEDEDLNADRVEKSEGRNRGALFRYRHFVFLTVIGVFSP